MITASTFKPAWWLRNPHAQTIWPSLFRNRPKLSLQRERFGLADGDFVDLDWTTDNGGPIVIVLHGLEGSSHSHYAKTMLDNLAKNGFTAGLFYFRGCSGEPNRLARAYHSGETGDIAHITRQILQRYPDRKLFAIGFSLGGNVLLKWLGETAEQNPLHGAVAISVPFDLGNTAQRLDQGLSVIYRRHLVNKLTNSLRRKQRCLSLPFDTQKALNSKSLKEFDNIVTAPLHGFASADDYYEKCSSRQFLKSIRINTLILHSLDDPFMTVEAIPAEAELSDSVTLELSRHGGHVGFTSGAFPWCADYWLEQRIVKYFSNQ